MNEGIQTRMQTADHKDTKAVLTPSALSVGGAPRLTSAKYQHVSSAKLVEQFQRQGLTLDGCTDSHVRDPRRIGYERHCILMSFPDSTLGFKQQIRINNSNDGSSPLRIYEGVYVFVCGNGLVVAERDNQMIKLKHNVRDVDLEELVATIVAEVKKAGSLDIIAEMKAKPMTLEEQITMAELAIGLRWDKWKKKELTAMPFIPQHMFENNVRREQAEDTVWNTYNRIQESAIRGFEYTNKEDRICKVRRIGNFQAENKINIGLWDNAKELVSVK